MVYQKLVEWIKSEEAQGFSEEQLRQSLLKSGYKPEDVNEAILSSQDSSHLSFNQLLLQKGKLFTALFYALLIIFSLELLAGIILPIHSIWQSYYLQLNFLIIIFSLLIAGLTINYVIKRNLYAILVIIFLLSPIGAGAGMLLFSVLGVLDVVYFYVALIYALIVGMIVAYTFNKVLSDSKKYLITGLVFSLLFDLILAIDKVIATIISKLALQVQEANNSGFGMGGIMAVAVFSIMKINVFLILMLIFFNIPYLIFYFRRKDKTTSPFLLYLIPLIIFIVLSFISTYVGSILLQAYTSSSSFPF